MKALGLGGMRMHEIEVEGGGDEPPPAGPARDAPPRPPARPASRSSVSLTHSRELAAAVVVAGRASPAAA